MAGKLRIERKRRMRKVNENSIRKLGIGPDKGAVTPF